MHDDPVSLVHLCFLLLFISVSQQQLASLLRQPTRIRAQFVPIIDMFSLCFAVERPSFCFLQVRDVLEQDDHPPLVDDDSRTAVLSCPRCAVGLWVTRMCIGEPTITSRSRVRRRPESVSNSAAFLCLRGPPPAQTQPDSSPPQHAAAAVVNGGGLHASPTYYRCRASRFSPAATTHPRLQPTGPPPLLRLRAALRLLHRGLHAGPLRALRGALPPRVRPAAQMLLRRRLLSAAAGGTPLPATRDPPQIPPRSSCYICRLTHDFNRVLR